MDTHIIARANDANMHERAKEGIHMVATNIPGAFSYADMDMLLEGTTAELIVKLQP